MRANQLWNAAGILPQLWLPLPNRLLLAGHNQTVPSESSEWAYEASIWSQQSLPLPTQPRHRAETKQRSPALHCNRHPACHHPFTAQERPAANLIWHWNFSRALLQTTLFPQFLQMQRVFSFQSPSANHSYMKQHFFHPGPDVASPKHSNNNDISAENRTFRGWRSMNTSIFCSDNWKKTHLLKSVYSGTVRKLLLHKKFGVLFK